MAIADRIDEALQKMAADDFEAAAVQISIAIDATAKAIYPKNYKVGQRFKALVDDNEEFILFVAMGCGTRFVLRGDGALEFGEKGRLSQVLYKYVRSSLIHEGELDEGVVLRAGSVIGIDEARFILGSEMLTGLILLLLGLPVNKRQVLRNQHEIIFRGQRFSAQSLWGRLDYIQQVAGFHS